LDSHLKVIGELTYDYSVVKPFRGVQLEIGGRIETYWKSTNTVLPSSTTAHSDRATPEPASSSITRAILGGSGGDIVSATVASGTGMSTSSVSSSSSSGLASFITASSLSGDYVRVVVQLTKDNVPVVYANWVIKYEGLSLAVSDLTFAQFCQLGKKLLQQQQQHGDSNTINESIAGNSMIIENLVQHQSFLSLEQVLKVRKYRTGESI
jgi:CDK inhibitor PHO81